MRLIDLHEEWAAQAYRTRELARVGQLVAADRAHKLVLNLEGQIDARLATGSIGWSEPLAFGVPDAARRYEVRR